MRQGLFPKLLGGELLSGECFVEELEEFVLCAGGGGGWMEELVDVLSIEGGEDGGCYGGSW